MVQVGDITITSLDVITAFKLDGTPWFIMDELQDAKIANTQEKQDITGKGGRKINSLKRNKAVTISGTNGLISAGMLEAQTGGSFQHKSSTPVSWTDYVTISSDKASTNYVAVGSTGAEIEALYIKDSNGRLGTALTQASTAAAGKFAYDPSTKQITFLADAYEDGTEIAVFYTRNIEADVLVNDSNKYSEKCQMYVDGTGEDKCGSIYRVQFYIPKADFSGDFDIDLGGDQAVHAFEAESLAGACSAGGSLWTYTVFGATTADASADDEE